MLKFVQGVQAVVRAFVQAKNQEPRGLCRVCRVFPLRDARGSSNHKAENKNTSRVYGCLHTLHTLHRPRVSTHHEFFTPAQSPAHPAQPLFY